MSTAKRLSMLLIVTLILNSSLCFSLIPRAKAETWTWKDEFTNKNSRWDWAFSLGTGYKTCPTTFDGFTVCEAGITNQTTAETYSDNDLSHGICRFTYSTSDYVIIEGRMLFTDTGVNPSVGSRGFGAYLGTQQQAWFWCASEESQTELEGWRCLVAADSSLLFNQAISFDPTVWHVYRIEISPLGTIFKIDEVVVASTEYTPATSILDITTWIDSGIYTYTGRTGSLDATINQIQYIDYIAYYYNDSPVIPEFQSWEILLLLIVATLTLVLMQRKSASSKQKNETSL